MKGKTYLILSILGAVIAVWNLILGIQRGQAIFFVLAVIWALFGIRHFTLFLENKS